MTSCQLCAFQLLNLSNGGKLRPICFPYVQNKMFWFSINLKNFWMFFNQLAKPSTRQNSDLSDKLFTFLAMFTTFILLSIFFFHSDWNLGFQFQTFWWIFLFKGKKELFSKPRTGLCHKTRKCKKIDWHLMLQKQHGRLWMFW